MHNTIIFDFDGTLIDSALGILATYAAVLDAAGITPSVPLGKELIGPPLLPTMQKLAASASPPMLASLVEDFKQLYNDIGITNTPAYEGAESALQQLRQHGKTLYLATNKRAAPTLLLIEKFQWQNYFHRIYCIDSHQPAFVDKTAMLRQLLIENHLRADDCLYVGDTRGDYLSATACDIKFIAAEWGYENWQAHPDHLKMRQQAYTSIAQLCMHIK